MSEILYTVQNLADEVRSQIDEQNRDSVDTERDILPRLNRAQKYAFDIYARRYMEPLLDPRTLTLVGGQQDYDLPTDTFEDRIVKMDIRVPSGGAGPNATFRPMQRIGYRDISEYETTSTTNIPYYYCIIGRKIRIIPTPSGTYNARLTVLRRVEKLVLPAGRITIVNNASNYIIVDQAGPNLTTEADQLGSYVNLINGQTGEIRGTLQIQSLQENRVAFRSTPARSTVVGRTVTGSLADLEVAPDDYICAIDGTCVPYFGTPTSNFMIEFAAAEQIRSLGGDSVAEKDILEKLEKQVEKAWANREQSIRIKKRSNVWGRPLRRWFQE